MRDEGVDDDFISEFQSSVLYQEDGVYTPPPPAPLSDMGDIFLSADVARRVVELVLAQKLQ